MPGHRTILLLSKNQRGNVTKTHEGALLYIYSGGNPDSRSGSWISLNLPLLVSKYVSKSQQRVFGIKLFPRLFQID